MYFLSTRGNNEKITASQAIIKGLSSDRGLFVPSEFKNLKSELKNLVNLVRLLEMEIRGLKDFLNLRN